MKVILAGYNIDTEVINDLKKTSHPREDVTPETLSASYARISRDPRPVNELRQVARQEVAKARRSNMAIIFKMGHHSVAEHAVFNFDIIGVSRLAIEEIEHFRLNAYTEKSQRYITLGDDFLLPDEIKNTKFKNLFIDTIKAQNDLYHKLYKRLKDHVFNKYKDLAKDPKQHNILDGWAKEDARYITSLATQGQLGITVNARNLELMLRRFASHKNSEIIELGKQLHSLIEKVAPSIILFYKANDYDGKTYLELKKNTEKSISPGLVKEPKEDVKLISYTRNADNITLSALIHSSSEMEFDKCLETVKNLNLDKKKELIKKMCQYMELYDMAPREFEFVNLTFNMSVSASCFAQLKRHRMASLITQPYNPNLSITMPESIIETGMAGKFKEVIKKTEDAYNQIYNELPEIAAYILTNAHKRRVLFGCNTRELYHLSRLREDKHAQWDIRNIAGKMSTLAKKVMPLTMMLIGGKDKYPEIYKNVYGKLPKITEAP